MLVEPDLDRGVLAAALQRHYGLAAGAMHFIPAGETAWCYRVTDERGRRWFLKLARPGAIEQARTEFALRLGGALADLGLSVPRPRPTRAGELWCWIGGLQVAVFEFIHGQPLRDQDLRAAAVARQAARLVAAVHAATPALAVRVPFVETFEVWTDGLRGCLAEIEPGTGGADELRAQARALVWPQRTALLGMLERLQALGDTARSRPRERVLCHGDLIGDNMLGDRGGRLWAVDWDGAALAPRNAIWPCSAARGSSGSLTITKATPGRMAWTRTWSPSSCCAATWMIWSTGWAPCSPPIGPRSSNAGTSTGCGGACRAGTRWRHASRTPAWCWRDGTDAAGSADACPGQVGRAWCRDVLIGLAGRLPVGWPKVA
jgi:aminoglycoside phosphotransferase (APT) family kinase protein